METNPEITVESIRARLLERRDAINADLDGQRSMLVDAQHMIVAEVEGLDFELVLGRFDPPGRYNSSATPSFCSTMTVPDHLAGVSFFPKSSLPKMLELAGKAFREEGRTVRRLESRTHTQELHRRLGEICGMLETLPAAAQQEESASSVVDGGAERRPARTARR